jgi:hypothetical protein
MSGSLFMRRAELLEMYLLFGFRLSQCGLVNYFGC